MRLQKIQEAKKTIDDLWDDLGVLLTYLIDKDLVDDFAAWRARWDRKCEEERHETHPTS